MVADDKIEIYSCYGNSKHIIIDGRVFEKKEELKVSRDDGYLTNFKNKLFEIFNDEKEYAEVTISINEDKYQILSDEEGYFEFELTSHKKRFSHNQLIEVSINGGKTISRCTAFIPTEEEQIGVISDFDDTLVISNVTDKIGLFFNLFLKNYKQRKPIKETYNIIKETIKGKNRAFFIVTGSPKQLHKSIEKFLDYHNFPKRTIITKKLHGENSDPIFNQLEYKFNKVKNIILLYPQIKWRLIGDSGEKDREAYEKILKTYPNSIESIYIRDVESGRVEKIF